jgi:hypothetical protein
VADESSPNIRGVIAAGGGAHLPSANLITSGAGERRPRRNVLGNNAFHDAHHLGRAFSDIYAWTAYKLLAPLGRVDDDIGQDHRTAMFHARAGLYPRHY